MLYSNNWGGLTPENKKFYDVMYERFVPWSGKANTIGGEILRAISRITYRFYNDGDTVERYYGGEYNLSAACDDFLCGKVPSYESLTGIFDNYNFEKKLAENNNKVMQYLSRNQNLFNTPNTESCIENAPLSNWNDDYDEDDDENEWDD